jgi:hypothetical protein
MDENDEKLTFVPLDVLTKYPSEGFFRHYVDCYWIMHPEKGAISYRMGKRGPLAPQCNRKEVVTQLICDKIYPWAEVCHIPSVFWPIDPHDYNIEGWR